MFPLYFIHIAFIVSFSINFRFASLHCPTFKQILRDQRGRVRTNGQFLPRFNSKMLLSFFPLVPFVLRCFNARKKKGKKEFQHRRKRVSFTSLFALIALCKQQAVCLLRDEIRARNSDTNFKNTPTYDYRQTRSTCACLTTY